MHRAKQEIFSVDVIDINHIGVSPPGRPRLNHHEVIAAVLELWRSSDHNWMSNAERVLPAKVGAERVVRDAAPLFGLNGLIAVIIRASLLVRMFVPVLIGLMVRALVLLFVLLFILLCAF